MPYGQLARPDITNGQGDDERPILEPVAESPLYGRMILQLGQYLAPSALLDWR
jgi:hypothetical protein